MATEGKLDKNSKKHRHTVFFLAKIINISLNRIVIRS